MHFNVVVNQLVAKMITTVAFYVKLDKQLKIAAVINNFLV